MVASLISTSRRAPSTACCELLLLSCFVALLLLLLVLLLLVLLVLLLVVVVLLLFLQLRVAGPAPDAALLAAVSRRAELRVPLPHHVEKLVVFDTARVDVLCIGGRCAADGDDARARGFGALATATLSF